MKERSATNGDTFLSADEIRSQYFGRAVQRKPHALPPAIETKRNELTPAAQYVARLAKKHLGQQFAFSDNQTPEETDLFRLIQLIERNEGEELSDSERTAVVATLSASLEHYDILTPLIENSEVNDIIVRAYNDVSVQTGRINIQTDIQFPDKEAYRSFVENLLKRAGKACTTASPVVDAAVDPTVRACVTHESFSPPGSGPMLTLRVARHQSISLEGLVQHELAPREVLDYLAAVVATGSKTLLIGGEVGTGKTTLVKAIAQRIPEHEALLVIEDTHELVLERRFVRTLLTREANTEGAGKITPAQAIRTGMRMAMNRIILGEMRDANAAEAFIDVCASGHPGMSTIHARSARDAIARLELFLARAQPGVSTETVRRQIANALSVVVFLGVDRVSQKRRIMEVLEVGSSSDGVVQVSPMFSYLPYEGVPEWIREGGISEFDGLLRKNGIELSACSERLGLDPEHLYRKLYADQQETVQ